MLVFNRINNSIESGHLKCGVIRSNSRVVEAPKFEDLQLLGEFQKALELEQQIAGGQEELLLKVTQLSSVFSAMLSLKVA